jgi:hypothetical protein
MNRLRLSALFVLLLLLGGCPEPDPTRPTPGSAEFGVTLLSVNLRDIMNHPETPTGETWQTRYTRIGSFLATAPSQPDFIVLQEASGYWDCPTDARRMPDYASIDFLLDEIRLATGEQYRIAYFYSDKDGGSIGHAYIGTQRSGLCTLRSGRALLYRASRFRNVLENEAGAFDYKHEGGSGSHAINSMPCCFPAADRADVCGLIDGPPQVTPRCTTPSPSGVSWVVRHMGDTGLVAGPVFSRFEYRGFPGSYLHIYNVHMSWLNGAPVGITPINDHVTAMEAHFSSPQTDLIFPPFVLGDFNLDRAAIQQVQQPAPTNPADERLLFFPRFDMAFWSDGLTGALIGRRDTFPSKQVPYVNIAQAPPGNNCHLNGGDPTTLWSDHCAIYVRVDPAPAP